jgi:hypothetical protein
MDRAEAAGFGVAVAGHALLLGILSVGFASVSRPPLIADPMEVAFVDEIGLKAALADPSTEAPAEAQAPEMGPPEEAAPAPRGSAVTSSRAFPIRAAARPKSRARRSAPATLPDWSRPSGSR